MGTYNVNTVVYTIIINGEVVGEYTNHDKAYHELRRLGLLTKETVTLTTIIKK